MLGRIEKNVPGREAVIDTAGDATGMTAGEPVLVPFEPQG